VTVDALHNCSVMRAESIRISSVLLLVLQASSLECTTLPSHAVLVRGGGFMVVKTCGKRKSE
jgi:hypothetical protein